MAAAAEKPPAAGATGVALPPPPGKSLFTANWFSGWALSWQAALIILLGLCMRVPEALSPAAWPTAPTTPPGRYGMMQDVSVMILVGFGFLYTLLRRYAWSGVSLNFIISVLALQWGLLCLGFWENVHEVRTGLEEHFHRVPLSMEAVINALFTAGTVLISFGAVIGRLSPTQALLLTFIEVVASTGNVVISAALRVTDPGGSMAIHVFGAAFGIAFAAVFGDRAAKGVGNGEDKLGTSRHNGTFAMVGTLFLWIMWPSFNAALLDGAAAQRSAINTLLSLCASTAVSFALSRAIHGGKHFNMEHVQNSSLAGGVAMGAACDMILNPGGALLTGAVAGAVSVYIFSFALPWLKARGLTDTCGILGLHLVPGLIGGFASAIAAAGITGDDWPDAAVAAAFPGRAEGRSALVQGGFQAAETVISLGLGALVGALTALLIRDAGCANPMTDSFYEDAGFWEVPYDTEEAPELEDDVASAIAGTRAQMTIEILAAVSASLGKNIPVPPAVLALAAKAAAAGAAGGGGSFHARSANERFLEGSVHNGQSAAAAARRRGEGSLRGGVAFTGKPGAPSAGASAPALELRAVTSTPPGPTASSGSGSSDKAAPVTSAAAEV